MPERDNLSGKGGLGWLHSGFPLRLPRLNPIYNVPIFFVDHVPIKFTELLEYPVLFLLCKVLHAGIKEVFILLFDMYGIKMGQFPQEGNDFL